MGIESLMNVIPPPDKPFEGGSDEGWRQAEEQIGSALPDDYKAFINSYGTGQIVGFIWVFSPFTKNTYLSLLNQRDQMLAGLKWLRDRWGDRQCPYPIYPELDGLLPWGKTINGDGLYWVTKGEPKEWTTVINEARAPMYEEHEFGVTQLLEKLVTGEIVSGVFPEDFLEYDELFTPGYRDHSS